mmetsp:Transcript_27285/g.59257  ORF Transcript_27285/g.59257 Transcript_27285/m.59257 type:complete len:281 (+) Transcript_27285:1-843(+)
MAAVAGLGFDGVKVDGCGPAHDIHVWSKSLKATGRPILLENCGDNHETWSPPLPEELKVCDFHMYRVSADIAPQFYSTMYNLQFTIPFQALDQPMSRPNCWAYPDMLQVGNGMSFVESRTHFSAWCIVSSPLILSFDLSNSTMRSHLWPIIANPDALAVNQKWAGHPGRLVASSSHNFTAGVAHGARCPCCTDPSKCESYDFPTWQVWVKPQPGGFMAALVINISEEPQDVTVSLKTLGLTTEAAEVRDLWQGDVRQVSDNLTTHLAPHDCYFVMLRPHQ